MSPAPETDPPARGTGPDTADRLQRLLTAAHELRAESVAAEAAALGERLAEGRFFVACVGQFKRGKSTLLNALVGDSVLPTGVVPVTSVLTVIRHGPSRSARVRLAERPWEEIDPADLGAYVAEAGNPENRKRVEAVEVFLPSELLAFGMCFVDTPGLGSVFGGGSRVIRDFVPHVGAALVVLGADPPISGDELELVEQIAALTDRLLFVLGKADRLTGAERAEAGAFAERVLVERLRRPIGRLFEVSATEALAGDAARDWAALVDALRALAREAGGDIVRAAGERGVTRLAERLLHVIDEHRNALVRPLDESDRRLSRLRQAVADAERAAGDLEPLLAAEQERLVRAFAEDRRAFLASAIPVATERLGAALAVATRPTRAGAMEAARAIAREAIEGWFRDVEPRAETLYRQASDRFVELANGFLASLRASGDRLLARLPPELPRERRFRARRQFHFTELLTVAGGGLGRWVVDAVGPRALATKTAQRHAGEYLERLLASNSARLANDLADRAAESRRQLQGEIAVLLRELAAWAERALAQARQRHAAGTEAVRAELERLGELRRRIEALRS